MFEVAQVCNVLASSIKPAVTCICLRCCTCGCARNGCFTCSPWVKVLERPGEERGNLSEEVHVKNPYIKNDSQDVSDDVPEKVGLAISASGPGIAWKSWNECSLPMPACATCDLATKNTGGTHPPPFSVCVSWVGQALSQACRCPNFTHNHPPDQPRQIWWHACTAWHAHAAHYCQKPLQRCSVHKTKLLVSKAHDQTCNCCIQCASCRRHESYSHQEKSITHLHKMLDKCAVDTLLSIN